MKHLSLIALLFVFVVSAGAQYSDQVLKTFEQSYTFEKAGDLKQSASVLQNIYQRDSYEFNLRLGWLYYNDGRFNDSKTYYQRAIALMPYSEEARFGIALPLAAAGEWDEIIKIYNQILENNPGNTVALYRLGYIYYERKNWTQAARHFQKVVDLYPFNYDGLIMMAWTNLQLGKTREARVLFNKALLWSPNDASALEGLKLLK